MSPVRRSWVASAAFASVVALALAAAPSAGAATGQVGPAVVSVSPTEHPADGTPVTVEAHATEGDLFEITVHLCRHGVDIANTFDFSFAGAFCTPNPVSAGSDAETLVKIPPGSGARGTVTFRVGTGTSPAWTDLQGTSHTLTCGNGSLCDVVVQLQVTGATRFFTAPLDGTVPAPPTTPPSTANPPDNPRGPSTTAPAAGATTPTSGATVSAAPTADPGSTPTGTAGADGSTGAGSSTSPPPAGTVPRSTGGGRSESAPPASTASTSPDEPGAGPPVMVVAALAALAVGLGAGWRLRRRTA